MKTGLTEAQYVSYVRWVVLCVLLMRTYSIAPAPFSFVESLLCFAVAQTFLLSKYCAECLLMIISFMSQSIP